MNLNSGGGCIGVYATEEQDYSVYTVQTAIPFEWEEQIRLFLDNSSILFGL